VCDAVVRRILFLNWNSALEDWVPAFGPDSAWDITSGQVQSAGSAKSLSSARDNRQQKCWSKSASPSDNACDHARHAPTL